MAPLQVTEMAPGTQLTTDDDIIDWVKSAAETTYHPVEADGAVRAARMLADLL